MAIDEGPPAQYLTAKDTSYCLVQNDYDRSTYGQCNYVANRTLIRCPQIRKKEDLLRNGGQCDQHLALRTAIKERYERDNVILRNSCPPPKSPRSRKFTRYIQSDQVVVEQDLALLPNNQWISEHADACYRNVAEDIFPFPSADIMSEKEYALHRIYLIKKELDCLESEKRRLESACLEKCPKRKKYESIYTVKQGRTDDTPMSPKTTCLYGHSDQEVVSGIVEKLVRMTAGEEKGDDGTQGCNKVVLPGSDFCIRHFQFSNRKLMFNKCKDCDSFALEEKANGTEGICPVHKYAKQKPLKPEITDVQMGAEDERFSDSEFITDADLRGPAAKKPRRPMNVIKSQVSFTSVPPGNVGVRRYSASMNMPPLDGSARCRPFRAEYFPHKAVQPQHQRQNLSYARSAVVRPALPMTRPPEVSNARLVTVSRGASQPARTANITIQRITTQDRQRNRMQQEEDMKAAASIADGIQPESDQRPPPGPPTQYRVVKASSARTVSRAPPGQFRQISTASLAMDIANLPEEVKNQPLGAVLRKGLISASMMRGSASYNPNLATNRPRMPVQTTTIRKPDTPMSSSMLTGIVRNAPAPNPAQRHQIVSVDVPVLRRPSVVPPHRIVQRPIGSLIPLGSGVVRPVQIQRPMAPVVPVVPPRVIPLEREAESENTSRTPVTALRPAPLSADFVTELVDAGRVPNVSRPLIPQPVQPPPPMPEEKPDLLRKKTRPSLPLPKLPNVLSRPKPKAIPNETSAPSQQAPASTVPVPSVPAALVPGPSGSVQSTPVKSPAKKKEKPTPRQGQRRSSRLDRSADSGDLSDPLSLLADVSVAAREPEK